MATAMGFSAALCALVYALCNQHSFLAAATTYFGIGASQGVIQAILIPVFMVAVSRGDLSVTWTILTLSFSMAATMSLVYPGAQPTTIGIVGLLLAVGAIGLLGVDMRQRSLGPAHRRMQKGWLFFMAVSFLLNGLAMYAFSLPEAIAPGGGIEGKLAFLIAAGTIFGIGGLALLTFGKKGTNHTAGLIGGAVGGTTMFIGSLATMQALSSVPDYIVYPSTTGGSGILVVALSVVLLKERPGHAGWLGIAVGLAALVLFALATSNLP